MIILCYSVRLKSLERISGKAFKATCFDGSSDIIPSSQVFGFDLDVYKSDAYWISAWILNKKNIQYSIEKIAYFNEKRERIPIIKVEEHKPDKIDMIESNEIEELCR